MKVLKRHPVVLALGLLVVVEVVVLFALYDRFKDEVMTSALLVPVLAIGCAYLATCFVVLVASALSPSSWSKLPTVLGTLLTIAAVGGILGPLAIVTMGCGCEPH